MDILIKYKNQKLVTPYLYNRKYSTWSPSFSVGNCSPTSAIIKVGPKEAPRGGEQITPTIVSTGTNITKKQNITFKGQTIKIGQKSLRSIIPNTQIKTLIPYGQHQGNTIGGPKIISKYFK